MKRKRGYGAMLAVFLVTVVIFGALYMTWSAVSTIFEPLSTNQGKAIHLVIQDNETTQQIADDLYKKGLIRNALAFSLWARIKGLDKLLQAGVYDLTAPMTIDQIIARLQNGRPDAKRLVVFEGYRIEQIANEADTIGLTGFVKQDFLNYTHHPDRFPDAARYPIVQHAPSMEGLLYADTYLIPVNYTTTQVIDLMLNETTQVIQQQNLVTLAQQHQLTEYQMVILASIVQREASNNEQMPLIAGIYWKRINQPSSDVGGPVLKSDPTVEYARETDSPPADGSYWQDLGKFGTGDRVDPNSPWNTYNQPGWPPTPISSPSLAALVAAANPSQTTCYYFYTRPTDGSLVCEATYRLITRDEQRDHLH